VKVHYTGRHANGEIFDSSEGRGEHSEPLEFTIGEGQVISGFETGVLGMKLGESRRIEIPADEAYGPRREELVATLPREQFPDNIELEVGLQLEMSNHEGHVFPVTVTSIRVDEVDLDANHPLAGCDLTFDIRLVEII
jgi:peptidylprolyl isomerase